MSETVIYSLKQSLRCTWYSITQRWGAGPCVEAKTSFTRPSTKNLRFSVIILSSVTLVASYFILLYTFLSAYLSPIKKVVVDVNGMGEANIELVFLLATIPCVAYYLKNLSWSSKKNRMWVEVDE